MSRPSFSKKRKGKGVPVYPLGAKSKSDSSKKSKRASRGRPKRPVVEEVNLSAVVPGKTYRFYFEDEKDSVIAEVLSVEDGEIELEVKSEANFNYGSVELGDMMYLNIDDERVERVEAHNVLKRKKEKKAKQVVHPGKRPLIGMLDDRLSDLRQWEEDPEEIAEYESLIRKLEAEEPLTWSEMHLFTDRLSDKRDWAESDKERAELDQIEEYLFSRPTVKEERRGRPVTEASSEAKEPTMHVFRFHQGKRLSRIGITGPDREAAEKEAKEYLDSVHGEENWKFIDPIATPSKRVGESSEQDVQREMDQVEQLTRKNLRRQDKSERRFRRR